MIGYFLCNFPRDAMAFHDILLQVRVPEVSEELQKSICPLVAMGFIILRVRINSISLSLGERYSLRAP